MREQQSVCEARQEEAEEPRETRRQSQSRRTENEVIEIEDSDVRLRYAVNNDVAMETVDIDNVGIIKPVNPNEATGSRDLGLIHQEEEG